MKRVDAVGNTTCYAYDALHRKTSVTYPSGPYAYATTANKYFVYDAATINTTPTATPMVNVKGRLAEAYTAASQTGSKITDEGFSYSARGEVSDVYEATPHSAGYYHANQTYWPHGLPSQLSQLVGLPTISYGGTIGAAVGLDGEGRITQVTASTGQNLVTGTSYNLASLPTQVNFGSGDSDVFAYDPNTLRMTQFKFNVGTQSQSLTGLLTWNANGTLGQLAITDQFNGANTQTCKYGNASGSPAVAGYDDLARLISANCGTAAGQTFSYDPFGNISKSGSPYSFQPTYNAATNRFATIPGATPSYDANGNVLADGSHSYAWDADGNSVTLDSVGLTFDALDRMVEQSRSGAYTQIVYAPTGAKLALMSGQTLQKALIPLPGQATAVYTSSGLDHYRHSDWLGSARLTSSPTRTYISSLAYAPFGETYAASGTTDPSFTGMNPDTASTDYDFLFREYSTQGRWPSPDPAGFAAVDLANPQSWNRYAYVLNDPCILTDPLGLEPQCKLKVFVDSSSFPSAVSLKAFFAELNRIFGDVGVGVQQASSLRTADLSVGLAPAGPDTNTLGTGGSGTAGIYIASLLTLNPTASPAQLGQAAGEVAVHEFLHTFYPGQGHQIPRPSNNYEESVFKPAIDPFTERLIIPPNNAEDIQKKCKQFQNKPRAGGGGGGGSGDPPNDGPWNSGGWTVDCSISSEGTVVCTLGGGGGFGGPGPRRIL